MFRDRTVPQEARGTLRIVCRVRPLLSHEEEVGAAALIAHSTNERIHFVTDEATAVVDGRKQEHSFTFDAVYDSTSTQALPSPSHGTRARSSERHRSRFSNFILGTSRAK